MRSNFSSTAANELSFVMTIFFFYSLQIIPIKGQNTSYTKNPTFSDKTDMIQIAMCLNELRFRNFEHFVSYK